MSKDYERGVEQASAIYKEVIREYVAENAKLRKLVKQMHTRELMAPVERTPYVEYDLCETCAAMVEERMKELTVTNLWERGAE